MHQEWTRGEYVISTDRARLDMDVIHGFLSTSSYWAQGRSRDRVALSIAHSMPFGLYHRHSAGETQVGFGRVLTDHVLLAYLADVFVLPAHRARGLGQWLVQVIVELPELRPMRRWLLGTRDAQTLYAKFGFVEPAPGLFMERLDPDSDSR